MVIFQVSEEEYFEKPKYVWFNGEFVEWDNAKIHVAAHALHYGSGVFEGIRAYKTRDGRTAVFRLREHLDRLFNSAKVYFIDIEEDTGFTKEDLRHAVKETIERNGLEECYIRPVVFRDYVEKNNKWGFLGVSPLKNPVSIAIITFKWKAYLAPKVKLFSVPWRRPSLDALPMMAKANGHYLNSQLARFYADMLTLHLKRSGALSEDEGLEALMLDERGYVSEGSGDNLFIVQDETIITPPVSASILKGITRASVIELAKDMGYRVVEKDISLAEVYMADEVFVTGTAAEIKPVIEVDFRRIGNGEIGPVTKSIVDKFQRVVRGEEENYIHWLDFV